MEKIRILRVIARLNVGGPAIHTILLSAAFENESYTTRLLAGSESADEGNMLYLAKERGVAVRRLRFLQREINLWKDGFSLLNLIWKILDFKPRIIHTHTAKAGMIGRMAALVCRGLCRRKIVLVHTFHGHVFHGYFSPGKTALFIWLERQLARHTQAIITITPSQQKEILSYKIGTQANHFMIPLGLDLDRFLHCTRRKGNLYRHLGLGAGTKIIGMVTRLVPVKNVELLLEIARVLCRYRQDIHWVIVGDGEERTKLQSLCHEYHLMHRVTWMGFTQELAWIYSDLSVLVLTSHNEGSPVALIEGMCAGVPVVSSRVGGVPDLIPGPEYGYLCEPGQVDDFCAAIRSILDHPGPAEEMARRNRQRIYDQYQFTRLADRLDHLYQDLLK